MERRKFLGALMSAPVAVPVAVAEAKRAASMEGAFIGNAGDLAKDVAGPADAFDPHWRRNSLLHEIEMARKREASIAASNDDMDTLSPIGEHVRASIDSLKSCSPQFRAYLYERTFAEKRRASELRGIRQNIEQMLKELAGLS